MEKIFFERSILSNIQFESLGNCADELQLFKKDVFSVLSRQDLGDLKDEISEELRDKSQDEDYNEEDVASEDGDLDYGTFEKLLREEITHFPNESSLKGDLYYKMDKEFWKLNKWKVV